MDIFPLGWIKNGFNKFSLCRISTIADGSCFFHSICNSFFIPYRTGILSGQQVSKFSIIAALRKELAEKLDKRIDVLNSYSPTYYDILGKGNLKELGETDPEYSLQGMKEWLDSNRSVGIEMLEYISIVLKKNIFILDALKQDVYITGSEKDILNPDWSCVILLYYPGHFETVTIQDHTGTYHTHFVYDNDLIQFLVERIAELSPERNNPITV